jgi:predicted DsbA family dithiol-disulfide isomerase
VKGEVQAELHFQPFELNPQMGAQGQDVAEHLTQKYGSTPCAAGTDPQHHP